MKLNAIISYNIKYVFSTLGNWYITIFIILAFGHGCYVCTPSNEHKREMELTDLRKSFPGINIRKCNEFSRSIRDEFILECPKDHLGCLTKFEGNKYVHLIPNQYPIISLNMDLTKIILTIFYWFYITFTSACNSVAAEDKGKFRKSYVPISCTIL